MSEETGLRERKKQRTRRTLSDTAIGLFLEHGFDQVSVADVAAAAEVSKPTLFRYFPAKEDLVLERIADHQGESARVVRDRAPGQSPLAALRAHFHARLDAHDPITGLSDNPAARAYTDLLFTTPSLLARLLSYTDRDADELTSALLAAASGVDASGMDASGMDASGMDASGMDASGMDASGMDASGMDASAARLSAGLILLAHRHLARENWRKLSDGLTPEAALADAHAAADRAYDMLTRGLGAGYG
ncbi:TetR family transcriptional regulator [Streptomyces varsoviensis]|uniref:TetR/AcrR family transcriptional regulator n=1 Tax=Streptomyces varsoviensis TaxID=67373 RepID=UPI0033D86D1F